MPFLETPRFPDSISYGSMGGPGFNTTVIEIKSGYEQRNVNWTNARHKYDVAYGVKTIEQLEDLIDYFQAVGGKAYGFRYKDWADYKSVHTSQTVGISDQVLGTGDGATTQFQLIKKYTKGAFSRTRSINKPVAGTVRVSIDDVEQTETTDFTVDTTTGIITFVAAPANGEVVKAGFQFDVPVRFDTDQLSVSIDDYNQGAAQVPLIELKV